ncbi:MAG: hypothetical protein U0270_33115 [Labilithrix sp.]
MRTFTLLLLAVAGLTVTSRASAESCADLDDEAGPDVIKKLYIENGDTQEFMIRALGRQLVRSADPAGKLRIIYRNRPTCDIRKDMFGTAAPGPVKMITVAGRKVQYLKVAQSDDPSVATAVGECTVPDLDTDAAAVTIQLGIGATYLSSCADAVATNPNLGTFDGPIQAYGFITHPSSTQNAISAEEGLLAYGFPEAGGDAQPWTVQDLRFKRSNTASTTLTMAAAVRLTPTKFAIGARQTPLAPESSDELKKQVHNSANPEATLGILGLDLYDIDRSFVKLLPFRSWDQRFAYYPDKTKDSFDKQNVRDGHYVPWAPTPYMAIKNGAGTDIADVDAKRFYDLVRGFRKDTDVDGLRTIAQNSLIPECAMTVTRKGDGADLEVYEDPAPCGCYYEANVKGGATACAKCTGEGTSCGTNGKCRLGFCEAR